jgi:hypothetical protein
MLIVQQIVAFVLGAFSVCFMLWFLANTLRESTSRYRRQAHPPIAESESWQFKSINPQAPSRPARVVETPPRPAPQPVPAFGRQFGQTSRFPHTASR